MENKVEWFAMNLREVGDWAANCGNRYDDFLVNKGDQWYIWTRLDTLIAATGPEDREEYHYLEDEKQMPIPEKWKVIGIGNTYRKFYIKVEG